MKPAESQRASLKQHASGPVGPPRPSLRCTISFDRPLNPYAMAVHHAAHAFACCLFDIPLIEISASYGGRQGSFVGRPLSRGDAASPNDRRARFAAEREGITLLAGAAAQVRGMGLAPYGYEWDDIEHVYAILSEVEPEEAVVSAWFEYLRERARVLIENDLAWRLIGNITGALLLRGHLAGSTIRRMLMESRDRRAAMPPTNAVFVPAYGTWPTL
jgi:hypothetical protein